MFRDSFRFVWGIFRLSFSSRLLGFPRGRAGSSAGLAADPPALARAVRLLVDVRRLSRLFSSASTPSTSRARALHSEPPSTSVSCSALRSTRPDLEWLVSGVDLSVFDVTFGKPRASTSDSDASIFLRYGRREDTRGNEDWQRTPVVVSRI